MDPDDAADVVGELEPDEAQAILVEMEAPEAEDLRELLAYPPESAAGLMTQDVVTVSPDLTAEQALVAIRRVAREAETIYYVYVTDEAGTLLGVLALRDLVLAPSSTPIGQLTRRDLVKVRADADQEVAARLLAERGLLAIPVVDERDRLLGIITADDAADVLEEEATEDMYHMAGIGVRERATSPALESARRRVPWLAFNMAWSLASAFVVSRFTGTIEAVAVLAVFMPVIAGQAGNAGIQTATIVIRSLALGEVRPRDTLGVLLREWGVGAIKGGTFGLVLALIAWLWFGNPVLGLVAGASLFLNIAIVASTTGVLLPMGLARLGLDPATIAGVFDTMLSDLMGYLIYLGLATLLIHWLV
jgi:magnesium transporter